MGLTGRCDPSSYVSGNSILHTDNALISSGLRIPNWIVLGFLTRLRGDVSGRAALLVQRTYADECAKRALFILREETTAYVGEASARAGRGSRSRGGGSKHWRQAWRVCWSTVNGRALGLGECRSRVLWRLVHGGGVYARGEDGARREEGGGGEMGH